MDSRETRRIEETIERGERVIAAGQEMLEAYRKLAPITTGNAATASVVTSGSMAAMVAVCAVLAAGALTWVATRDRDAADRVRVAQVETINARWQADIQIRDARGQAQASERTAELRILAADRRADMAELKALQSQLQDHTDDLKGVRAWLKINGETLAKLEARTNAK